MAFTRITLAGPDSYDLHRPSLVEQWSQLIIEWTSGGPRISRDVTPRNNNRVEKVEIYRSGSESYLEFVTSGGDLRGTMERDGQVWLEFASHILHLPQLIAPSGGSDPSEPYRWSASEQAIVAMVAAAPAAYDDSAVLTLWDGAGANPFDHDKLKLGDRDIVRTYIGSRLRVREYIGAAQVT